MRECQRRGLFASRVCVSGLATTSRRPLAALSSRTRLCLLASASCTSTGDSLPLDAGALAVCRSGCPVLGERVTDVLRCLHAVLFYPKMRSPVEVMATSRYDGPREMAMAT